MGRILVGISSWTDRTLVDSGRFYPPDVTGAADLLRYYSARFSLAEVDSSYYKLPPASAIELWVRNTPPGFVFDVKAFRLLTRHPTPFNALPRALRVRLPADFPKEGNVYITKLPPEEAETIWRLFAGSIEPLQAAGKLGLVLFQFPPWFHYGLDNLDYLAMCADKIRGYRLGVEFRAAGWLSDAHLEDTLQFLRRHQLALVCVDEPQGLKSSVPPVAEATAPVGVVRFHGRNRDKWEQPVTSEEKFGYLYREEELAEWASKVHRMGQEAEEVHVIFKNKTADFPVVNARQMQRLLHESVMSICSARHEE